MAHTAPALNAATERRYEETLERRRSKSDRRELLGAIVLSTGFTAAAVALALLATPARDLNPLLALAFAAAYALAVRIEFTTGAHFAVPTQLVFVPMLLLLPTPLVPLILALANAAMAAYDMRRGLSAGRLLRSSSSSATRRPRAGSTSRSTSWRWPPSSASRGSTTCCAGGSSTACGRARSSRRCG
jgi:hypothetical protein